MTSSSPPPPPPPADQALEIRGFRIAGVHYWQGNWNFNFWTNLGAVSAPSELTYFGRLQTDRIFQLLAREIVLSVPVDVLSGNDRSGSDGGDSKALFSLAVRNAHPWRFMSPQPTPDPPVGFGLCYAPPRANAQYWIMVPSAFLARSRPGTAHIRASSHKAGRAAIKIKGNGNRGLGVAATVPKGLSRSEA